MAVYCGERGQLEQKSGLFIVPNFKKTAWKTERKEGRSACWALRKPMMFFQQQLQEVFFLVFVVSEKNVIGFFLPKNKKEPD